MKNFYVEILHPTNGTVLWHYYLTAPSKQDASDAASKRFIEEQTNGILLDTDGLFIVTAGETD